MPKRSAQTNNGGPLQKKAKTNPQPGRSQRTALSARGPMSSAPVSQGRVIRTGNPVTRSFPNGDCLITHREYIGDINASTGAPSVFASKGFAINPAQPASFPWLAAIAARFESYRFESLRFCYETEAPSSLGGSLIMTVDYDASDQAPQTKQQAMAYRNAVRSAPWEECQHVSNREDLNKRQSYYCRPGAVPASADVNLYDVGNLFVCTQNVTTASAVCGELYVEYSVRLMTPVYESSVVGAWSYGTAGMSGASPLGSAPISSQGALVNTVDTAGAVVTVSGLTVGQEYQATWSLVGTTMSAVAMALTSGGSAVVNVAVINASATNVICLRTFVATATSAVLTLSATAASVTGSTVYLAQIPLSSVV